MKKILANTVYSDATLKSWKKEDLIEHIRTLEHNWQSTLESLNNSAEHGKKLYEENEMLKRLMSLIDDLPTEQLVDVDKSIETLKARERKETTEKCIQLLESMKVEEDNIHQWRENHNDCIDKCIMKLAKQLDVEITG